MEINPISVTELNKYIKTKIEEDDHLANVFVKGEISNFKNHHTGHMYFTLKDENSLIKCIMFKAYTSRLKFVPKDGVNVLVFGTISVFERDGQYQLYCKAMQEDGVGTLHKKFEELKINLEKEGLFDIKYKKKIPYMPKIIGVLTSKTGSVVRDIINVSTRRNPNVYLRILPIPVQGEGAAIKIVNAIKLMNEKKLADVIIIARGGGSLEDLWPFNEEITARAIFESEIPIVSAVGHETDFTISDFVSDLRAPTPSAAAEIVVPNILDVENKIYSYKNTLKISLKRKLELIRLKYERCMASSAFKNPLKRINDNYVNIDNINNRIINIINKKIMDLKINSIETISKLDTLSPLKTLIRGYCIVEENGKIIKSKEDLKENDKINLKFADGSINAKII